MRFGKDFTCFTYLMMLLGDGKDGGIMELVPAL